LRKEDIKGLEAFVNMAKDGENQFDGTKNEEILHTVDENRALG